MHSKQTCAQTSVIQKLNPTHHILSVSNLLPAPQMLSCLWLCYCDPIPPASALHWMNQPVFYFLFFFSAAWDNTLIMWPGKCFALVWLRSYQTIYSVSVHSPAHVVEWFTILNRGWWGGYVEPNTALIPLGPSDWVMALNECFWAELFITDQMTHSAGIASNNTTGPSTFIS